MNLGKVSSNLHSKTIRSLKYLSNGYVASSSSDFIVNIWDPISLTSIQRYTGHTSPVYCFDQIDKDTMLSVANDLTIQTWKISTGKMVSSINVGKWLSSIKVLLNVTQIACALSGSSDNLRIYSFSTSSLVNELQNSQWSHVLGLYSRNFK